MNTWRELDAATRRSLLRGEPATDPEVDRIARAYAEGELRAPIARQVVYAVPLGVIGGIGLAATRSVTGWSVSDLAPFLVLAAVGYVVLAARRKLALTRILNVSHGTPREPVPGTSSEALAIRVSRAGALRMMAPYLIVIVALLIAGAVWSMPWLAVGAGLAAVPVLAYTGYLLTGTTTDRGIILDAHGLHYPHRRAQVAWESVREIRVFPLRATASDQRQVIAFILHDDEHYLRQLPAWEARLCRMNRKTYLSSLVMIDGFVDTPVGVIAATAAALSRLPVTASH
ncbi:hypothetical protein NN3_43020 [Nocardia neocaledoniensis NBRC 108232]|uniref:Uncharacterized protein n=1 Tax=Nocardia neocaledoniensis TaxID=236511 RepID=A0A317P0N7_9NOCA|nr:hypothetical protein [Nocardia neocaledoniensis]PWV81326.1 hypothetical protein DFR69_101666 [Nocardia neocaledoniensis]GEM33295.1 hypothetical protein NN3_43020 [Nocardia neocaledoniensis NBRC 108232]